VNFIGARDKLQAFISGKGGFNANSITRNVDYLITNTPDSGSSKNRKARDLGIPVISEADFMAMAGD
jgi:DNA ligase (NAD+)